MSAVAEHLDRLVRIPSASGLSNRPLVEYVDGVLHTARWQTREFPYRDANGVEKVNLIAAPSSESIDDPAAELAFFCHTDTVPFASDWARATDPFVRDGFLHGCGAADVKGFLACLLVAASDAGSSRLIPGLRLVFTADEEVGCIGAGHLLDSGAIRPRRAVVGEPTSLHPARAGKGYCLAEVTVFGQEAHSALPQSGASAIYRAARLISAIEELAGELAKEQHPFFDPPLTTLNIGTIQGGTAKNVIAGQCHFQLEWRPIPGQAQNAVPDAVSRLAANLQKGDSGFRCSMNIARQQSGFETPAHAPIVRFLQDLTAKEAVSIPFASEASPLAVLADEVVVFGPGDMQTAHSSRERVPVDELETAVEVVKSLMVGES